MFKWTETSEKNLDKWIDRRDSREVDLVRKEVDKRQLFGQYKGGSGLEIDSEYRKQKRFHSK